MAHDKEGDELLARARKLQQKLNQGQAGEPRYSRSFGRIGGAFVWLFRQFTRWLRWLTLAPAADGESGDREFSRSRLVRNLMLSFLVLFAIHTVLKAAYYYGTYFEEMVYVTGKQEIETGELYQFGGCTSLPCSTNSDNGKFYLIESSLYLPQMFYPEEDVFANIPQQDGACHVEGYGIYFRTLRWLYKAAQLYQHVVNVSCRPYTQDEIKQAVDDGQIVRDVPE